MLQNQFMLALIDGNRYTFGDSYLKNTETGGTDAGKDLVAQIRSYIQERHLHDNPNEVVLMVHIFADKSALSQALVDSGTISESKYLDAFIAKFMNSQPFLYFMDCGPSEGAVDTKIKGAFPNPTSDSSILTFSKNHMSFILKMLIANIFYWRYATSQGTLPS